MRNGQTAYRNAFGIDYDSEVVPILECMMYKPFTKQRQGHKGEGEWPLLGQRNDEGEGKGECEDEVKGEGECEDEVEGEVECEGEGEVEGEGWKIEVRVGDKGVGGG